MGENSVKPGDARGAFSARNPVPRRRIGFWSITPFAVGLEIDRATRTCETGSNPLAPAIATPMHIPAKLRLEICDLGLLTMRPPFSVGTILSVSDVSSCTKKGTHRWIEGGGCRAVYLLRNLNEGLCCGQAATESTSFWGWSPNLA